MTSQDKIRSETSLKVVYEISEHVGYWEGQSYHSQTDLILGAIARGYLFVGRNGQGWPVFGPGVRQTWQGQPDTLYGPDIETRSDGSVTVRYANTGAAYLWGWKGLPVEFHTSDL